MKAMLSSPMRGKTSEEIEMERKQMIELLDDYEVMDTIVEDYENKTDLECFAESIKFMSQSDVLVMGYGWENARGCILEHNIALAYDLPIIYLAEVQK